MPAFYPEGDEPKLADPSGRSLHKINNLLKSIDAKTGSTTITGPVTVSNEVEVTNSTGNPIPVSGTVGLDSTSLAALENISVTFPATQNVNVTNAGLTINDMTSGNAKTKIVDSVGADVSYITAGTAGTPSAGVLSVQGVNGGVSLPISGTVTANVTTESLFNALENYNQTWNDPFPVAIKDVPNGIALPTDLVDSASNSRFVNGALPISGTVTDVNIGQTSDSAATTDTGTFSVIALIKRSLQNWTTLLAKIPALVSGRIPVDGSGVTQPVSGTVTAAQATAANLNATVVQGTATNLRTAAEVYTGGSPVSASNALTIKTTTALGSGANVVSVGYYQSGANSVLQVSDGSGLPVRPANSTTFAVTGTFWQATQPVSGTVTINNSQGASVTQSTFTSTTASTSLVAASANRKTLTVFNEGAGMLYVSVGSTCTTTAYQVRLSSGDYWECPPNQTSLAHTAVFATAGNARVTEVV